MSYNHEIVDWPDELRVPVTGLVESKTGKDTSMPNLARCLLIINHCLQIERSMCEDLDRLKHLTSRAGLI